MELQLMGKCTNHEIINLNTIIVSSNASALSCSSGQASENLSTSQEVTSLKCRIEQPETVSQLSTPLGFGNSAIALEQSLVAETQQFFMTHDGSTICNEEDLRKWIFNMAKPAALQLGLSSNQGMKFIDKALLEVGTRNLKEKCHGTVNDDEIERHNYENSNAEIGEALVSKVLDGLASNLENVFLNLAIDATHNDALEELSLEVATDE
ncbi:hypothetical protein FRX31_017541 [Thalictrum thalictroides]|uniref:Uncharacterized protein n=1 Tax=Thalictrum thalictroides TaxID=46969 RepID=A0A7J6W9G2_THATH|nr:hypothetical protein FRX31_017541 [Thalictrum thalictroides]